MTDVVVKILTGALLLSAVALTTTRKFEFN